MQNVFGPVPSRRLGYSLGVDIIPPKYCSYDCIYCQAGKTTDKEILRKRFYDPEVIVAQVADRVATTQQVDIITFSGSGEPTLNLDLGVMIRGVKKRVATPVAVITNGSLLHDREVRADLAEADVVLPSLDAVSEEAFKRINRPHPLLDVESVIAGLKKFRQGYTGPIWLEIMLIRNVNDDPDELKKMAHIVSTLGMDKIQLNTVTRPPSDEKAGRLEEDKLQAICKLFGPACEVICSFEKVAEMPAQADWSGIILETLKRRPLTLDDVVKTTSLSHFQAKTRLKAMEEEGLVKSYVLGDDLFYIIP
ncbi:MAG: radical SAM protein [Syntrophorhabdaceae bacterium]|nr:radical SAM protein [Syntrophorhabdaceae bacterium]